MIDQWSSIGELNIVRLMELLAPRVSNRSTGLSTSAFVVRREKSSQRLNEQETEKMTEGEETNHLLRWAQKKQERAE